MKTKLQVVKVGGRLLEDKVLLPRILKAFASLSAPKILVHGGGNKASEMESKLGLQPRMIGGRRITSEESLDVVVMVYAGLLNKSIVAGLQALDCNAIGLCGADGSLIKARKRPVMDLDFGFVGDVTSVHGKHMSALLHADFSPILCALTHDGKGQLLNTNADTIATEVAIAMSEYFDVELKYCLDLPGVMEDPEDQDTLFPELDESGYRKLKENGVIQGGMLPKLDNCFHALKQGVRGIRIGNSDIISDTSKPHTFLKL